MQTTFANHRVGIAAGMVIFVSCGAPAGPQTYSYAAADGLRLAFQTGEDAMIDGLLYWQGKTYVLEGEWADEDEIAGYAEHSTASLLFEIEIDDGRPHLTLMTIDEQNDLAEFELVASQSTPALTRQRDPAYRTDHVREQSAPPAETTGVDPQRDSRLAGVWAKQDILSDSTMSVATQSFMKLDTNGVLSSGPSRTIGGDAGWSGDTGMGGEAFSVYWRTEGQILQISTGPDGPWRPFASYHTEGGKLLLSYYDGSRDLWYRQ